MTVTAGTELGSYDILAPLGAGAFCEVYKARDIRLDRTLAINIPPSTDPELKARFEREAKAIAALQRAKGDEGRPAFGRRSTLDGGAERDDSTTP
jgi:serine/threonine protein kinase